MKGTKKTRWIGRFRAVWQYSAKLVIFLVVTGISEIFTVRPPTWRSDDKQEGQAKNDYYEATDSVLQIGHLSGSNRVQGEFHANSFKMLLWR